MAPLRLAPMPGLPGKLSLCGFGCGSAAAFYSQPLAEPLSSTPVTSRVPSLKRSVSLEGPPKGPFPDADDPPPYSALQRFVATLPMLAVYGGVTVWAYFAWYHNHPMRDRLVVNDSSKEGFSGNTYAGGADKMGHFYATYLFARVGAQSLIDRGWTPLSAVLVNVAFTLTFFTLIEVKDGYHMGFGFSVEDQIANVLGTVAAALLLLVPTLDDLFGVRMYYRPSKLFLDGLLGRKDIDIAEDYTGETVMLVFKLGGLSAVRNSRVFGFLRYVELLFGYNARGFMPKPGPSVMREQELFLGFSLNLVEVLRDLYPNGQRFGWAAKGLADISEYLQITPLLKTARSIWRTPQPLRLGHWVQPQPQF